MGDMRGIIPARAGFTASEMAPGAAYRDHPRACGVYTHGMRPFLRCVGSSPRVRGLHAFRVRGVS